MLYREESTKRTKERIEGRIEEIKERNYDEVNTRRIVERKEEKWKWIKARYKKIEARRKSGLGGYSFGKCTATKFQLGLLTF